ncbi:MAG: hypothetical protein R3B47_08900 [Bacteroidia bacterium]
MKVIASLAMLLMFYSVSLAQCKSLAEAAQQPREIDSLDLCGCSLNQFPAEILKMKNLKVLYLGPRRMIMYQSNAGSPIKGNLFKHLPESFGRLRSLEVLDLQATDLRELPDSFEKLQVLKELDLSFNPRLDTASLFEILPRLESLQTLNLTGCNLDEASTLRLETLLQHTHCVFNKARIIARD